MSLISRVWKQSYFLPAPVLTEKNLPDQKGRVFIVTGGYAGCGFELSKILYQSNGTVYIAGRTKSKAEAAMKTIKTELPRSEGQLHFLSVDLSDLDTIKPAVEDFLSKEERLDVLTNNAGVMFPPAGSKAAQGYELQIATNCLGSFLFTRLLTPVLKKTANLPETPAGGVRVTWAASTGVDVLSPAGGVTLNTEGDYVSDPKNNNLKNYGASKAGNYFLASQFALRHDESGIVSNAWHPGNLSTQLQRHMNSVVRYLGKLTLHPARFGGYTELWAGWAEEAGRKEHNGKYVWPWGRFGGVREDVQKELGEAGKAEKFWEWCERETRKYA